jgi:hypothetical protein
MQRFPLKCISIFSICYISLCKLIWCLFASNFISSTGWQFFHCEMLSQRPLPLYLFYIHISSLPFHPSYFHTSHYVSYHIPLIPSPLSIHFFFPEIYLSHLVWNFPSDAPFPPSLLPSSYCPIIAVQPQVARVENTPNCTAVLYTMGIAYQLPCGPASAANWLRTWGLLLCDAIKIV